MSNLKTLDEGVRADKVDDLSELLQSMKDEGWWSHMPAIADEHGIIIDGRRRIRAALQLKIKPVIQTVKFGDGEDADNKRVQAAMLANAGSKAQTADDRRMVACNLYQMDAWTQQRIADVLHVSQQAVAKYLAGLQPSCKPHRPKGGRPKSTPKPGKISMDVRRSIAKSVIDGGLTTQQAEVLHGVSNTVVRREIAREQGRLEVLEDPPIDPNTLSKSAQEKLAAALRQQKKEQALTYTTDVQKGVHDMLKDTVLPYYEDAKKMYERAFNSARGLLTEKEYKQLLRCLHPDTRSHAPAKDLDAAFMLVRSLELSLMLKEHRKNVVFSIPTTMEELLARKAAVAAARKAGRGGNMVRKH